MIKTDNPQKCSVENFYVLTSL